MQEKNQQIVNEFLSHSKEINEDIMADIEKMLGVMPFIFNSLKERPEIVMLATLADYNIGRPKTLSPKTAELIAIAAAAGAGAESCLKVHIKAALNEGVTRDEILDTIMIAAMMGKTKILASALRLLPDPE
ncbi:MAG: carboxymuconolactone decarboxylase family protein [Methanomicrobiales archaeon]|jgi:AhpD family alkylhydroperoxidase|nr:carboxymuconolactone decarboxylase family protein [Methanomicrobiales archaeon]